MINTPIGQILILINGKIERYHHLSLPRVAKSFAVDERYQIIINDLKECELDCILVQNDNINESGLTESGEDLELISFYYENLKVSIGVEGDIPGIKYKYIKNGIKIDINNNCTKKQFKINVAWLYMKDPEKEDIYSWFAADPTLAD